MKAIRPFISTTCSWALFVVLIALTSASSLLTLRGDSPKQQDLGLPELHKINSITLEPSYSCRSREDFQKGYEKTALYLSTFSRDRHYPELLFNGACKSPDDLEGMLAGDDMSLIADLGALEIENVSAQSVFITRGVHFERYVPVQLKHTYALLVNRSDVRGLVIFSVIGHTPNERLDLRYAVKEYQVVNGKIESSPGFDWGKENQ